jgi:hypothetical protein
MTITHRANLLLSLVAFGMFVANQLHVFAGRSLDLSGEAGAYILAGFLALGLLVQFAKLIEGHRHWLDLLVTVVLLVAHIAAELTIWLRTQVMGLAIPTSLPRLIVGLYWLVGALDMVMMYGRREANLLLRGLSVEGQRQQRIAEAEHRAIAAETQAALARQEARLQERFAQQIARQRAVSPAQIAGELPAIEPANHERTCPRCGRTLRGSSARAAINALNGHMAHCPSPEPVSENGRH